MFVWQCTSTIYWNYSHRFCQNAIHMWIRIVLFGISVQWHFDILTWPMHCLRLYVLNDVLTYIHTSTYELSMCVMCLYVHIHVMRWCAHGRNGFACLRLYERYLVYIYIHIEARDNLHRCVHACVFKISPCSKMCIRDIEYYIRFPHIHYSGGFGFDASYGIKNVYAWAGCQCIAELISRRAIVVGVAF